MRGKEFALSMITTFFAAVTLISAAIFVLGSMLAPDATLGYDAFLAPLIYGALGTLPNIVLYSRKELSVPALLLRKAIQFVLIEAIILFIIFLSPQMFYQQPKSVLAVALSVLIIYVTVNVAEYLRSSITAGKLTDELKALQKSVNDE